MSAPFSKERDEGVLKEEGVVKEDSHDRVNVTDSDTEIAGVSKFHVDEKRKLGVTGAVFLILNKMIGTGSKHRISCLF